MSVYLKSALKNVYLNSDNNFSTSVLIISIIQSIISTSVLFIVVV